jgi:Holliday junction DNA helicase RuvA
MISQLNGIIEEKGIHSVVVDVQGIGYELELPLSTAVSLPDRGQRVRLYTHFVVREDAHALFGFLQRRDRDLFRTLIRVNGVGPKLALAILSGLDSTALVRCVLDNDVATLVKVPGIGRKTAERLLIELRDRVRQEDSGHDAVASAVVQQALLVERSIEEEAESALIALGYKPQDAGRIIKKVRADGQSLEQLIKAALKSML